MIAAIMSLSLMLVAGRGRSVRNRLRILTCRGTGIHMCNSTQGQMPTLHFERNFKLGLTFPGGQGQVDCFAACASADLRSPMECKPCNKAPLILDGMAEHLDLRPPRPVILLKKSPSLARITTGHWLPARHATCFDGAGTCDRPTVLRC